MIFRENQSGDAFEVLESEVVIGTVGKYTQESSVFLNTISFQEGKQYLAPFSVEPCLAFLSKKGFHHCYAIVGVNITSILLALSRNGFGEVSRSNDVVLMYRKLI